MNSREFVKLVIERNNCSKITLAVKEEEYSSEKDRLHNFVQAGKARGTTPMFALDGMLMKHIVSFWDIVDEMENNPLYVPSKETVDEKFGDIHNYLYLAEALVEDRRKELYTPQEGFDNGEENEV